MRAFATFSFLALFAGCATVRMATSDFAGTYDLLSLGTRPVPNDVVGRLWMEVTTRGTWEMFEEPEGRFGGTRGLYQVADTVEDCVRVNMWPEIDPGARAPVEFCEEGAGSFAYLQPVWLRDLTLDGSMVFKRRQ